MTRVWNAMYTVNGVEWAPKLEVRKWMSFQNQMQSLNLNAFSVRRLGIPGKHGRKKIQKQLEKKIQKQPGRFFPLDIVCLVSVLIYFSKFFLA